ncbi:cysteine peptidase family C39 domain-containing protein [Aeromonas veronii]
MFKQKEVCLQGEPSECGLACLSYISEYSEKHYSLQSLRAHNRPSSLGTTLKELEKLSGDINVSGRSIYFDASYYDKLPTPCIIHLNTNHYVVLEKVNSTFSIIMNPALGRQILKNDFILAGVSGYAIVFENLIESKRTFSKRGKLKISPKLIGLGMSIAVLSTVIPTYLFGFDNFIENDNFNFNLLIIFMMSQMVLVFLSWLSLKIRLKIEAASLVDNTDKMYHKLLSNKVCFFERRNPSDITNKLVKLVAARVSYSTIQNDFFISGIQLFLSAAVLLFMSYQLALVVIGFSLLLCFISNLEKNKVSFLNHVKQNYEEKIFKSINESSDIIYDIKSSHKSSFFVNSLRKVLIEYACFNVSTSQNLYKYSAIKSLLSAIEIACVFYICFQLTLSNELSLAYVFIIFFVRQIVTGSVDDITEKYISLGEMQNSELRGRDIVDFESDDMATDINTCSLKGQGSFELSISGLTFKYDQDIIKFPAIHFYGNRTAAIIGDSGCGKTTLLKLISGIYTQSSGVIVYNGNILSTSERRHLFYYHTSNQKFFSGTLYQNMTMNATGVHCDALSDYINSFEVDSLINRLPDGLNTLMCETTHPFSDGEKSRLLLCRAFVSTAKLLLIDEPTKSLDKKMTKQVVEKISSSERCVLFTSHDVDLLDPVNDVVSL